MPTLIDVPPNESAATLYLEGALEKIGYSIEDVARIIVTHPHFDHFGSAEWIVTKSQAEVWIFKDAVKYLENPQEELEKDLLYYRHFLEWAGTPKDGGEYLHEFYRNAQRLGCTVQVSKRIEDGERIEIGDSFLTAINVPGHTPWCTILYDPQNDFAFTGDFLIKNVSSNAVVQRPSHTDKGYKSLKAYISSLNHIKDTGLRRAFPGHGEEIEDAQGRITEILSLIRDRQRNIIDILTKKPSTPYEIMDQLLPHLSDFHVMLGISEVVGHLELLEEDGVVERDKSNKACLFYLMR
ncbi:MAG: Hydroxyacylglutathione hydrolase [Syntrophorhabdaceae bacterium PtaU1.Bin034]|nr:MAG: Hydroxyacylglutathione hydrolase [Syntrophorhabdaceae bacterium PtaU1.Bin034]